MRFAQVLLLLAVLGSSSAAGDEPISYSRFLIPLYQTGVSGAFGSIWESSTWVLYTGPEAIPIIPRTVVCEVLCPGLGGTLYSNRAPQPLLPEFASDTGVLAYVPADHANEVTFGSRVRDVTRDGESAGTEVPVVPVTPGLRIWAMASMTNNDTQQLTLVTPHHN